VQSGWRTLSVPMKPSQPKAFTIAMPRRRFPPLAVHAWAAQTRCSITCAKMAQHVAAMAEPMYEILVRLRDRSLDRHLPPPPPLTEWLPHYETAGESFMNAAIKVTKDPRERRKLREEVGAAITWMEIGQLSEQQRKRLLGRKELRALFRVTPSVWRRIVREYVDHLEEIKADLRQAPDAFDLEHFEERMRSSSAIYFSFVVTLRCLAEYQVEPGVLLQDARAGDATAIEKLLRLDPRASHEPTIAEWIHGGRGADRSLREREAFAWMTGGINGQFQRRGLKCVCAGAISALSARMNLRWRDGRFVPLRLTPKQIRELFDAAHRDRTGAVTGVDKDLAAMQPEAWEKAIQRHRAIWNKWFAVSLDKASGL
jgi:hypothetical protein